MSKHHLSANGRINQDYKMGGLIIAFLATNQAVAIARHRKMSQYTNRAELLALPPVQEHELAAGEAAHHQLYFALKRRYPECRICLVGEQPFTGRRPGGRCYPGHALLRKVCMFLNDHNLMPLAFAAADYASPAERNKRTREEWVALDELGKRYGLH